VRWFRFAVLTLTAAVLQAGLLASWDIKPDLLLVLLAFFAIYADTSEAIITSFVVGFAADIVGPAMGPQIISFGLFGTLLSYLRHVIAIRKMAYQAAVIFIVGFSCGVMSHLLSLLAGQPRTSNVYTALFETSLCSCIVGPFLFLPLAWWMRIKKPKV